MTQDIEERIGTVIDRLEAGSPWGIVREDLINIYADLGAGDDLADGRNPNWWKVDEMLRPALDRADSGERRPGAATGISWPRASTQRV